MTSKVLFFLTFIAGSPLLAACPALAQVQPEAAGGATPEQEDTRMMTPPPVSRTLYTTTAGDDMQQNYVATDVTVVGAFIDNVLPASTSTPIANTTISVLPDFSLDRSTTLQQETLSYSPSFTFFMPTSVLDSVNQSANGTFKRRLSPNLSLAIQDNFVKTSNIFDESYPFSAGGFGGSTQAPVPAVIAPFAEQLRNIADATSTYQFSRNGMIGGGWAYSTFRFPNPTDSEGLFNSNESEGSAFYSRRISSAQYLGVTYEYARVLAYSVNLHSTTQTHTPLAFYTIYFNRTFSLSVAAGAAHVSTSQAQQGSSTAWSPVAVASMGWQGNRGTFAISYLRTVTSGGGLVGAYTSNGTNVAGGWKFAHTWSGNTSFSYQSVQPADSLTGLTYQGGNGLLAQISLQHALAEHINIECGYQRMHEEFGGIAVISASPDANREFVNVTYEFRKFLGR